MLFPYKYVSHKIERLHRFINFIFYQVWCRAYKSGTFNLDLFNPNPLLKELMKSFYYGDTVGGDRFYLGVEKLYADFANLTRKEVKNFKRWYQLNNDIKTICEDKSVAPLRYFEIKESHPQIHNDLATFFKGLYSQDFLELAAVRKIVGNISEHYQSFIKINDSGKCPFCGTTELMGQYHSYREAYDHYLPKAYYPFNTINFHNLVPACHRCNSTYKNTKDPSFKPKDPAGNLSRRKSFYPFSSNSYSIDLKFKFTSNDIENLEPKDIEISYGPENLSEEIDSWRDVYGIDERYKAVCLSNGEGKSWYQQVMDEWKWKLDGDDVGRSPQQILRTIQRYANDRPFADSNFLKKAFLEGCDDIGLFD